MPRESLHLPIQLSNGQRGHTHDLSAGGMYFFTSGQALAVGEAVAISIDLNDPAGDLNLTAQAEVLRFDRLDGQAGVAVRWLGGRLSSKDSVPNSVFRGA